MRRKIGKFKSSISNLDLVERMLTQNTLILAEEGSGKTHLANKIREYAMDNNVPTLYLDISDPDEDAVESRFKESGRFYYIRYEESDAFDAELTAAIANRENIYMAVNSNYFSNKRDITSRLSKTIQSPELLENYYYFFHEISMLNAFYTKFEDFMFYILSLVNLKKYGMTFLTQPH
ncbi:MAG: ATP-binding protein, partial [Sulfurimonadaceae bacterium]